VLTTICRRGGHGSTSYGTTVVKQGLLLVLCRSLDVIAWTLLSSHSHALSRASACAALAKSKGASVMTHERPIDNKSDANLLKRGNVVRHSTYRTYSDPVKASSDAILSEGSCGRAVHAAQRKRSPLGALSAHFCCCDQQ